MIFLIISAINLYQAYGVVPVTVKADRVSSCRFTLFKEALTREEANERCRSYHKERGVLAEIRSEEENEEIRDLLQDQQKAWIGLSYTSSEWRWDTGSILSEFSRLNGDNVIKSSGLNTYITKQGQWNISVEKDSLPFVCRMNGEYMVFTTPVTRNSANKKCQSAGMILATVQKAGQIRKIKQEIRRDDLSYLFNWFWIGGRDPTAQGYWLWDRADKPIWDGTKSALKWEHGVTTPREGPLYMAFNKITGRVRALHEQFKNPYVCQCPAQEHIEVPRMQNDYGSINSNGKYVPLFRANVKKTKVKMNHSFKSISSTVLKYNYVNKLVTHGEAEAYCQGLGGHLACPRNSLQQSLIRDTIRGNSWLAIVDVDEEQVYRCIGEKNKALTFTNWYQRFGIRAVPEPDNMTDRMKPGASYVQILYDPLRSWRHGKWIDRGSPQYEYIVKSAFVCEHKETKRL